MTESTITKIDSDRAGYQNIGLFIGPAIFLVMLAFSNFQQTMSIEASFNGHGLLKITKSQHD